MKPVVSHLEKPERRQALRLCLGLLSLTATPAIAALQDKRAVYLSCCKQEDGSFAAAGLDIDGKICFLTPLQRRGHGSAVHPRGNTAVILPRRPGTTAVALDLHNGQTIQVFHCPENRHFYGHGCFSADGDLLYATENDYHHERGVIGIYAANAQYRRLGEWDSGGIGPHECLLLSTKAILVVANGGIATHPDYPRRKLNIASMAPCITLIDVNSGERIKSMALPVEYHQLSLRHLALAYDGSIWFGGQYEGAATDTVPLVGRCLPQAKAGDDIQLLPAAAHIYRDLRQYIGSVSTHHANNQIVVTSPKSGRALIWDGNQLSPLSSVAMTDICGVAAQGNAGFIFSSGQGKLFYHPNNATSLIHQIAWDNHMVRI